MFHPLIALALFVFAILQDVMWAHWSIDVNRGNPLRAALYGAGIMWCSGVSIVSISKGSVWYIVPLAVGAGIGTAWVTRRRKHAG